MDKHRSNRQPNGALPNLPTNLHDSFVRDFLLVVDEHLKDQSLPSDVLFMLQYQKDSFLSKFSGEGTTPPDERRSAAIAKWLRAEERNRVTNTRLLIDEAMFGHISSGKLVKYAREVVRQVIGDSPPEGILADGRFSNGASTRVSRSPTAISRKFVGEAHATIEAMRLFSVEVLAESEAWIRDLKEKRFSVTEVHGSMMFTVPKNSEIDRVACKEPEINMYLQLGAGEYISAALRKRGINLRDQTANQRLALEGSLGRKLSTLDLSSASDLISTQLVYLLLPIDWFLLLDAIRVKRTLIDGEWHELNMFSSMGNGFTFPLESLLFYALSCAINRAWKVRGRVSVYGDDIITPTAIAPMYVRVFSWFGFKINIKKSFWRGPFRESCGKHYYDGTDVTPFYLRKPILTHVDLIHQLNQLRNWATRDNIDYWLHRFYDLWDYYSRFVPPFLKGGKDPADPTSLVTCDRPRKRIVAVRRDVDPSQDGAYLQWLHAADRRQKEVFDLRCDYQATLAVKRIVALAHLPIILRREATETSVVSIELPKYQVTRNRVWNAEMHHHWWHELVG